MEVPLSECVLSEPGRFMGVSTGENWASLPGGYMEVPLSECVLSEPGRFLRVSTGENWASVPGGYMEVPLSECVLSERLTDSSSHIFVSILLLPAL